MGRRPYARPRLSSLALAPAYYPAMSDAGLSELVGAAAEGDQRAWQGLVERFSGLVWSVARAHGLSEADAADVAQTAWVRLVEHLHHVRDAQRVGAWLATTARHEALRSAPGPAGSFLWATTPSRSRPTLSR